MKKTISKEQVGQPSCFPTIKEVGIICNDKKNKTFCKIFKQNLKNQYKSEKIGINNCDNKNKHLIQSRTFRIVKQEPFERQPGKIIENTPTKKLQLFPLDSKIEFSPIKNQKNSISRLSKQNIYLSSYSHQQKSNENSKITTQPSSRKNAINPYGTIMRLKSQQSQMAEPKRSVQMALVQLGMFSQRKNMQIFLRRFKSAINKEFIFGPDLQSRQDLIKMEFILLRQIHNEGKWIE